MQDFFLFKLKTHGNFRSWWISSETKNLFGGITTKKAWTPQLNRLVKGKAKLNPPFFFLKIKLYYVLVRDTYHTYFEEIGDV